MIPDKKLPSLSRNFESLAQIDEIGKMFDSLADAALRQPDNADILQQLWLSVEANENFSDSKALHETVLDLNPYSYHAWYNLGYAYLGLNDPKNAMEAFEFSHITNRYFEPGYREFAQLAFNSGRFRSALYCYQELVENLGEEPDVMVRIGECYHRLGDAKIARAMYEKALKMDPFHAEAYFKIGEFFASQKEYHAALKWLREAIRKEEKRGDFHAALAEVCYCIGKVQDAEDHFWRAVELAPDEQPQWTRLVKFYMAVGKPEDALETLSSALDNAVEQNELLYCHSACLFLLGKRNQAIKQLRKALTADFSCREALFHTVPALVHDNEVRRLIESFQ